MKNVILTLAMLVVSFNAHAVPKKLECLASVIWHEARGEPLVGQIAVGHVVLNRKRHKNYPNTICAVAFQKDQFTNLKHIKYDSKSLNVAIKVWNGTYKPPYGWATHYHTTAVKPAWRKWDRLIKLGTVGKHIFYRLKDMPLYDFSCVTCDTKLAVLQKITDPAPVCPTCGKSMNKLITAPSGFEFKGGGYYVTDFKNKKA